MMLGLLGVVSMLWGDVTPRGTEGTFDLVTWNIEQFPKEGQATIDTVRNIILGLQVDVIAVQEITDTVAFRNLVNSLEDWEGVHADDNSHLWTGILYRTDQVTVSNLEMLFPNQWYPFPRPPLMAWVEWEHGQQVFDFHLIVWHLKAMGGSENIDRRRQACTLMKNFIDQCIGEEWDPDFIIAGDFNDEIDDPPETNSFTVFLDDSAHYQFLTMPLAGNPWWASYPSSGSLIDHILVTEDALGEYDGGWTETLRLEQEVPYYSYYVSDHRPVMSQFPVDMSGVVSEVGTEMPMTARVVGAYPNPWNPGTKIEYELSSPSNVKLTVYDLLGREIRELVDDFRQAGSHKVQWDGLDKSGQRVSSGVYFIWLNAGQQTSFGKIVLLR